MLHDRTSGKKYKTKKQICCKCNWKTAVDRELASIIPTPIDMGAVYQRLIINTLSSKEDYVDGIIRVYNDDICDVIDNYNCSAFYEPSYVIARAYQNGGF